MGNIKNENPNALFVKAAIKCIAGDVMPELNDGETLHCYFSNRDGSQRVGYPECYAKGRSKGKSCSMTFESQPYNFSVSADVVIKGKGQSPDTLVRRCLGGGLRFNSSTGGYEFVPKYFYHDGNDKTLPFSCLQKTTQRCFASNLAPNERLRCTTELFEFDHCIDANNFQIYDAEECYDKVIRSRAWGSTSPSVVDWRARVVTVDQEGFETHSRDCRSPDSSPDDPIFTISVPNGSMATFECN
jgi:hypothetical protein